MNLKTKLGIKLAIAIIWPLSLYTSFKLGEYLSRPVSFYEANIRNLQDTNTTRHFIVLGKRNHYEFVPTGEWHYTLRKIHEQEKALMTNSGFAYKPNNK